jgi:hypothetical protein
MLMRYRDQNGQRWADIIDKLTVNPDARRKVARWVEGATEPVSQRDILDAVTGKRDYLIAAVAELVRGGYLKRTEGARGAFLHTSERPFREDET